MQKNQRLFILCGEAFAGKSSLAKKISEKFGAKIVGRDAVYFAIENILALEETPEGDGDKLWLDLWPIIVQGAKNQLLLGHSVVIDDNCLYFNQREDLRSLARQLDVKSILVYLNITAQTLKQRKAQNKIDKNRHDVPSSWLEEDARIFERPTEKENPIVLKEDMEMNEFVNQINI